MKIEAGSFLLSCEEKSDGLTITSYEGEGAVLDLSGNERILAIGRKAFLGCRSLQKVLLPESIRSIGDWAFSKCRSLRSVRIEKEADGSLFERGVFEGCEKLEEISFRDMSEGASALLAASVTRLENEHLLRAEDPGQRFWYEKWDLSLLSLLRADDAEGSIATALCGEEDISYDGVGMVDGEMPGETDEYVRGIGIGKCLLCYLRLRYPEHMSAEVKTAVEAYLRERSFGKSEDRAWAALKEDFDKNGEYLRIYLDIVRPDRSELLRMIADLKSTQVLAKALLIREAASPGEGNGLFDDLMI